MRSLTRLSTAACTLAIYLSYLLSEPKGSSYVRLAESFGISHDSVNRFLQRENDTSQDLFHEVKGTSDREGGTVSVDDTVLDKPYSKIHPLINYFWSGNHKRVVEAYHRILKQVCNVEHFHVRTEVAIRNHIFCALCGYIQLEIARIKGVIANHYEFQRTLFLETIGKFIREHVDQMVFVNAPPRLTVNA
jgi:hypothetical protein